MGEIKKYDESGFVFQFGAGTVPSREVEEIKSLKPGEYWIEDHACDSEKRCALQTRLGVAAIRYFGKGNCAVNHRNGIIAVLRKA